MTDQSTLPVNISDNIQNTLGNLDRAAHASIRGYFTQILYTALTWLDINDNEVLIVEGREDLDKIFLDKSGNVQSVNETQLKDLSTKVNARSDAVWESIFNFLLSHQYHKKHERKVQMLFVTTAGLKRQNTSSSTEVKPTKTGKELHLEIDVFNTWSNLSLETDKRNDQISGLIRSIKALFDMNLKEHLPAQEKKEYTAQEQWAKDVSEAIEAYDNDSLWPDFFSSVSWEVELGSPSRLVRDLEEKLETDRALCLPKAEFARVLIHYVLSAASKSDVTQRFLTKAKLTTIIQESKDSLEAWASDKGLVNLDSWNFLIESTLSEHGERIEILEGTVQSVLPTHEKDWESIKNFTRSTRRRIRTKIGQIHLPRDNEVNKLREAMASHNAIVLIGGSGIGKSAIVKIHTETLDSQGGLTCWLGGTSLERSDLASLQSDMSLGLSFEEIFNAHPGPKTLVIDGLDRIYDGPALTLVADLLDSLKIGSGEPLCKLIITSQSSDWSNLADRLRDEEIDISDWEVLECAQADTNELTPLMDSIPKIRQIANDASIGSLIRNLKILDIIASNITNGNFPETNHFVSESSVANWFWKKQIIQGQFKRSRDSIAMRIGERQADELKNATSLLDFQSDEVKTIGTLENDKILYIDDSNSITFSHDLYADWSRLRILQSKQSELEEYLCSRIESPLWHRAIRLLGGELLDRSSDLQEWKALMSRLESIGGLSAADLLLDSIIFSSNTQNHLKLLEDEFISEKSELLDRFLGRFLAFATLPDPFILKEGQSIGMNDAEVAAKYRYPNWTYWPIVLLFLYKHREKVVKIAPEKIGSIVKLWLQYTNPKAQLRQEAGKIALLLGHCALNDRSFSRENRVELFEIALSALPECEDEVIDFALKASERTTAQQRDDISHLIDDPFYPISDPNPPMPTPFTDGPNNPVDDDFRRTILQNDSLLPLMSIKPEVAREVILACLIESRHIRSKQYSSMSDEWERDIISNFYLRGAIPGYFQGPFKRFLDINFTEGLETILRFISFATQQWFNRREKEKEHDVGLYYSPESNKEIQIEIDGSIKNFIGDDRTLGWSAGLGHPLPNSFLTSALMALEQHLYEAIDSDEDIEEKVTKILNKTQSTPVLHVLLDVGRKSQELFSGPLMPLIGVPELYFWETIIQDKGRYHLNIVSPFEHSSIREKFHNFNNLPHRNLDLSLIILPLFFNNEEIHIYLSSKVEGWQDRIRKNQDSDLNKHINHLILTFTKENYELRKTEDNNYILINKVIEEKNSNIGTTTNKASLIILKTRYRRWIEENKHFNEEELDKLVVNLKEIKSIWNKESKNGYQLEEKKHTDRLDYLANEFSLSASTDTLAGGIAVLICLNYEWVSEKPDLLQWCKDSLEEILNTPPPTSSMDSWESASDFSWDCFAAEAIVTLWRYEPDNIQLRNKVAEMIFSYHNQAVSLLMRRAVEDISTQFDDIQRLRRLVFEYAHLRNRANFINNYKGQLSIDSDKDEDGNLTNWHQDIINQFVEYSLPPVAHNWEEMNTANFYSSIDENYKSLSQGYSIDFSLIRAAHISASNLNIDTPSEERVYRIEFFKNSILFWKKIIEIHTQCADVFHLTDDGIWLLDNTATSVLSMRPEEEPEKLWSEIITLPKEHNYWIESFFDFLYLHILEKDSTSSSFIPLIERIIDFVFNLPPENRWRSSENVWPAMFGIHHYVGTLWSKSHISIADSLWPKIEKWATDEKIFSQRHLTNIAKWLSNEAAVNIRFAGLSLIRKSIASAEKRHHWSDNEQKNAIAELLQLIWADSEAAIRTSKHKRSDFQAVLSYLGSNQHSLGLELIRRIGNL